MTKVTLPRKVAEALEELRNYPGVTDEHILTRALRGHFDDLGRFGCLSEFVRQRGGLITLASAIINGYEVEKTPHDKVREHYEKLVGASGSGEYREQYLAAIDTVKIVLDLLGVTIDGINGANNAHSSADN